MFLAGDYEVEDERLSGFGVDASEVFDDPSGLDEERVGR